MFDSQLDGIYSVLDDQLRYLTSKKPNKEVVSDMESQPKPVSLTPGVLAIHSSFWWTWQLRIYQEKSRGALLEWKIKVS